MSLLLSSERSLAASRHFSPLTTIIRVIAEQRKKRVHRANLVMLLEMDDARLADIGLTRHAVRASLAGGKSLEAVRRASASQSLRS